MISFALESPGFESHTDILSLSLSSVIFLCCFYYYCETTDTADENLDLWITSSVTDHSHTWDKNIPFYGCQRFFGQLVSS